MKIKILLTTALIALTSLTSLNTTNNNNNTLLLNKTINKANITDTIKIDNGLRSLQFNNENAETLFKNNGTTGNNTENLPNATYTLKRDSGTSTSTASPNANKSSSEYFIMYPLFNEKTNIDTNILNEDGTYTFNYLMSGNITTTTPTTTNKMNMGMFLYNKTTQSYYEEFNQVLYATNNTKYNTINFNEITYEESKTLTINPNNEIYLILRNTQTFYYTITLNLKLIPNKTNNITQTTETTKENEINSSGSSEETQKQIEELQNTINELNAQIETLNNTINEQNEKISNYESQIKALENSVNTLQSQKESLEQAVINGDKAYQNLKTEYNEIKTQYENLKTEYETLKTNFETIKSNYKNLLLESIEKAYKMCLSELAYMYSNNLLTEELKDSTIQELQGYYEIMQEEISTIDKEPYGTLEDTTSVYYKWNSAIDSYYTDLLGPLKNIIVSLNPSESAQLERLNQLQTQINALKNENIAKTNTIEQLNKTIKSLEEQINVLSKNDSLVSALFWNIGVAPYTILSSMFNFEIGGINIFVTVTSIVSIIVIIWLIKKLI